MVVVSLADVDEVLGRGTVSGVAPGSSSEPQRLVSLEAAREEVVGLLALPYRPNQLQCHLQNRPRLLPGQNPRIAAPWMPSRGHRTGVS